MPLRILLLPCIAVAACSHDPEVRRFGGETMGSTYEVQYVDDVPLERVRSIVEEVLDEYDRTFSKWRDDSEIVRCNRAAATAEPFEMSGLFLTALGIALQIAKATGGGFDPTIEPVMRLYREAKAGGRAIDPAALAEAVGRVGYRQLDVSRGVLHRSRPGVEIDLDGIVAGRCLDDIAARLMAIDMRGFYLEVTGEIRCRGEKAPGKPWVIGVVDPRADLTGGEAAYTTLALRDRAICTSGDYRNAFESGGEIVSHIFDPRSGRSANSRVVSASVLCESAAIADAVGTALLVLGEGEARAVVRRPELKIDGALLLVADDGGLRAVEIDWPKQKEKK